VVVSERHATVGIPLLILLLLFSAIWLLLLLVSVESRTKCKELEVLGACDNCASIDVLDVSSSGLLLLSLLASLASLATCALISSSSANSVSKTTALSLSCTLPPPLRGRLMVRLLLMAAKRNRINFRFLSSCSKLACSEPTVMDSKKLSLSKNKFSLL